MKEHKFNYRWTLKDAEMQWQERVSEKSLLPTPTASNALDHTGLPGKNGRFEKNPRTGKLYMVRDTGWSYTPTLVGLASLDMLPTPTAHDSKMQMINEATASRIGKHQESIPEVLAEQITSFQKTDGEPFRLSPLFTEEMMGFPLMWTTLPFLSESGREKASKPTVTP